MDGDHEGTRESSDCPTESLHVSYHICGWNLVKTYVSCFATAWFWTKRFSKWLAAQKKGTSFLPMVTLDHNLSTKPTRLIWLLCKLRPKIRYQWTLECPQCWQGVVVSLLPHRASSLQIVYHRLQPGTACWYLGEKMSIRLISNATYWNSKDILVQLTWRLFSCGWPHSSAVQNVNHHIVLPFKLFWIHGEIHVANLQKQWILTNFYVEIAWVYHVQMILQGLLWPEWPNRVKLSQILSASKPPLTSNGRSAMDQCEGPGRVKLRVLGYLFYNKFIGGHVFLGTNTQPTAVGFWCNAANWASSFFS